MSGYTVVALAGSRVPVYFAESVRTSLGLPGSLLTDALVAVAAAAAYRALTDGPNLHPPEDPIEEMHYFTYPLDRAAAVVKQALAGAVVGSAAIAVNTIVYQCFMSDS